MQKNNKKRKIIIAVTSILLIIAIAILVSTVVRNSISVNEENYETANGSVGSSYLLPEYIKEGVTIGGVTGTLEDLDTSDATATAADIALGKTAYVKGVKITGTYVSIPDLNSSNTTFRQNISYWTNQSVTVNVTTTVSGWTEMERCIAARFGCHRQMPWPSHTGMASIRCNIRNGMKPWICSSIRMCSS